MRLVCGFAMLSLLSGLLALSAQPPGGRPADTSKKAARDDKDKLPQIDNIIERLMVFDKNKDGKLTKEEITDRRLLRLFDTADTNKDGAVTKEELRTLATRMVDEAGAGGPGGGFGPPDGGPPGGPGGGPPGGRFGPGGFGPPAAPGQIMPRSLQDRLKLTPDQKKQVDALQVEVDAKLAKILTAEQKQQLKDMRDRFGRGGPGGPGGGPPGGRGRGGPPPDDGKGPPPPRPSR